jgi:hypothetical protein
VETENIQFWLKLAEGTLVAEQPEDTIKHLDKISEMLTTVFNPADKVKHIPHWHCHMLVQEISGNVHLGDLASAYKLFRDLNKEILKYV